MNIVCPACSTRYAIADGAIGVDGRVVRCAKCRHSWFQEGPGSLQDGPQTDATPAEAAPVPAPPPADTPPLATATPPPPAETLPPPDETSQLGEAAAPSAYPDLAQTDDFAETPSSFAHEPPFRPRRHPATFWVMSAIVLALLAVAAIAAMATFGVPDWLPIPRDSFARATPDLVLEFPASRQQPRPLPNGSRFFNVSGSISNTGKARRVVPPLLIVLRDERRMIVYVLETAPPKTLLNPGESETVDQAIIDAPSSARTAEIGWKPR